jgi:tRNA (uracil-5-)-methyltransferase
MKSEHDDITFSSKRPPRFSESERKEEFSPKISLQPARQNAKREKKEKPKPVFESVTAENCDDLVRLSIEPLHQMTYDKQLALKASKNKDVVANIQKECGQEGHVDTPPTIGAPETVEYRSGDVFSIQKGVDGNPKTVGYYVRSGGDGGVVCVGPEAIGSISRKHKDVATAYQEFLWQSELSACYGAGSHEPGHWRSISVKSTSDGSRTLAVVSLHPQQMDEKQLDDVKRNLGSIFGSTGLVDSLYLTVSAAVHYDNAVAELVYGEEVLVDRVLDGQLQLKVQITFLGCFELSFLVVLKIFVVWQWFPSMQVYQLVGLRLNQGWPFYPIPEFVSHDQPGQGGGVGA